MSVVKVVVLIATIVLTTTVSVGVLALVDDTGHILPAVVAVALCLPPAMVTLILVEALRRRAPAVVPFAVIVATGLRMGVAVIGVLLFGEMLAQDGVSRDRFSTWLVCVYLLALAVESSLLVIGGGKRTPQPESTGAT